MQTALESWNRSWKLQSQLSIERLNRSWKLESQLSVENNDSVVEAEITDHCWKFESRLKVEVAIAVEIFPANFEKLTWNPLYPSATIWSTSHPVECHILRVPCHMYSLTYKAEASLRSKCICLQHVPEPVPHVLHLTRSFVEHVCLVSASAGSLTVQPESWYCSSVFLPLNDFDQVEV